MERNANRPQRAPSIKAEMIDELAVKHFPTCMRNSHQGLRADHRLNHFGRLEYGLFLKVLGLSVEEANVFWRKSFDRITDDTFNKMYKYNIRHSYGHALWHPIPQILKPCSCQQILTSSGDPGCPFRHFSVDNLRSALVSTYGLSSGDVNEVMKTVKDNHFHVACTRVYEITRASGGVKRGKGLAAGRASPHPNQYAAASMALAKEPRGEGRGDGHWVMAEFDVLNNEQIRVDFRPLFEPTESSIRSHPSKPLPLSSLPSLIQEISGFFIIETHVLQTTGNFRSERDVEELWDGLLALLTMGIENALRTETDPDSFLSVKESLLSFIVTLEVRVVQPSALSLHSFIIVLFEKYGVYWRRSSTSVSIISYKTMTTFKCRLRRRNQMKTVLDVVLDRGVREESVGRVRSTTLFGISLIASRSQTPYSLPWSQTFYLCCQDIRSFIQKFYAFVEGVSQHHRNIDELLSNLSTLTQIAQIVTNLEYLQVTCIELQRSLTSLRSSQRGGSIVLTASSSFEATLARALQRITGLISSKLDDFFGLSEYNWTPAVCEDGPAMYLYELVNWLTTVVDALVIKEAYKDEAYKGAVAYIADCLMDFLTGRNIPMMNENAVSNILIDVDFLEEELRRIGRGHLCSMFIELRTMTAIALNNTVQDFLVPANRQTSFAAVKHKKLQALLDKLAKYGASQRDAAARELGDRRRREADAVGRLFPGEGALTSMFSIIISLSLRLPTCARRVRTRLPSSARPLNQQMDNITDQIPSKLDAFFELSSTAGRRQSARMGRRCTSTSWLTTVIDGQTVKEASKDEMHKVAKVAFTHVSDCLMIRPLDLRAYLSKHPTIRRSSWRYAWAEANEMVAGRSISMMNENAVSNILIDVDFLEQELRRIGRGHLCSIFVELRATTAIVLNNTVDDFLVPCKPTNVVCCREARETPGFTSTNLPSML
ncbi:Rsec15 protein [Mycena chlorophos]|uniref:Rsec15 protein n=1 Tax=Mycena chlorophos TaxID=658473 RepID=A0A8H6VNH3_MYCCL|nr:Rsec15 protein [Mycena chlorophos]